MRALFASLCLVVLAGWGGGTILVGAFSQGTPGELPADWRPMAIGDEAASRYELVRDGERERTVVRADAEASASGLVRPLTVDARSHPVLEWEWKIEGVIPEGRMGRKDGDDFPARIYVTFAYDPKNLSFGERLKYEALRAFTSFDIPLRAVSYVWANHPDETDPAPNPFTDWVMMVPVRSGPGRAGEWVAERRDLYEDYRRLFGEEPPPISGIAIMTDADNTGGTATAYYGDIALERE